jgi:Protein of unknown function (DUF5132)
LSHQQEDGSAENGKSQSKGNSQGKRNGVKSAYLWGAASGLALAVFAPMLRPAAKQVVKGGIKVGRQAKKIGYNLKEEFEDIAAEAQADLERESPSQNPPRQA